MESNEKDTVTYQSIEKELVQAGKNARDEVERLRTKKRGFINDQTFTGVELMIMRNLMKSDSSYEPNLFHVLEKILEERN